MLSVHSEDEVDIETRPELARRNGAHNTGGGGANVGANARLSNTGWGGANARLSNAGGGGAYVGAMNARLSRSSTTSIPARNSTAEIVRSASMDLPQIREATIAADQMRKEVP